MLCIPNPVNNIYGNTPLTVISLKRSSRKRHGRGMEREREREGGDPILIGDLNIFVYATRCICGCSQFLSKTRRNYFILVLMRVIES